MGFSKVSVIGLGYIGLPTAAIIASRKIPVIGIDINPAAVDTINDGRVHFTEPDLDIVVHAVVMEGYLKASLVPESADVFIIAVPTPFQEDHQPDLSYIHSACNSIAPVLKKGDLIILESTSPVGTTELIAQWLSQNRPDLSFPHDSTHTVDVNIAYCPERVLPGHVLRELVQNSRIIGGITPACSEQAVKLYKTFVEGPCLVTDSRTAEMCKLTENSFRDVNIAFANELSIICDQLNINVWELIQLSNHHPRVNILQPGPGVGGHCIAVDPWFIVSKTPEHAHLIRAAREVNDSKPAWVVEKVQQAIYEFLQKNTGKTIKDITIACLGLSFKADIDDLRESPSLKIVHQVTEIHRGNVLIVEPHIEMLPDSLKMKATLLPLEDALKEANILLLLVDHKMFRETLWPDLKDIIVVDVRGIIDRKGLNS